MLLEQKPASYRKKKYHFIKTVLRTGTEREFLLQKDTYKTVLQ